MDKYFSFLKKKIFTILLRPFTALSLLIGVLFLALNVSDSLKIAIIINIFMCSILGIIFISYNLQKMSNFYHYHNNILVLIDIILHIIAPSIVIGLLYKNVKKFNIIHSLIFGITSCIIYLSLFDYQKHYAYVLNLHTYIFIGLIFLFSFNLYFFKKFSS